MPKRMLVKYKDTLGGEWWWDIAYRDTVSLKEGHEMIEDPPLSLKELADFCDQNAESRNNHSFLGTHRLLAMLLSRVLGEEQATLIMRDIAEYGGLDAMSGNSGQASAFADFGIKECWEDWEIT